MLATAEPVGSRYAIDRKAAVRPTGRLHPRLFKALTGAVLTIVPANVAVAWYLSSDRGPAGRAGHDAAASSTRPDQGRTAVDEAVRSGGQGFWAVYADGSVATAAPAPSLGSLEGVRLQKPIVHIESTNDGNGYWLLASDGGIFSFGDAKFYGSTGSVRLNQPVVGMAGTPQGGGYWLVASDGGIFSFGNAKFRGSATNTVASTGSKAVGVTGYQSDGYWIQTSASTVIAEGAPLNATAPQGPLPADQNPSGSTQPSAAFEHDCLSSAFDQAACDRDALADINNARAAEGYGPLALPSDYGTLSVEAQVLATANAERASRGLAPLPESSSLDSWAQQGAQQGTDPRGPSGYSWGSNISMGYPTALSADFAWMYDDGPNSTNADCSSSDASGCWGHRDNILQPWTGGAGAGAYVRSGTLDLTQLFAANYK